MQNDSAVHSVLGISILEFKHMFKDAKRIHSKRLGTLDLTYPEIMNLMNLQGDSSWIYKILNDLHRSQEKLNGIVKFIIAADLETTPKSIIEYAASQKLPTRPSKIQQEMNTERVLV